MSDKHGPHAGKPAGAAPFSTQPRRNFISRAAAVVIGGLVGVFPVLAGLGVLLDPLRKRKAAAGDGWITVTTVGALRTDGTPQRFPVSRTYTDAWTLHENEPVGAVYLRMLKDGSIQAFTSICPHLGCSVDFKAGANEFQCPCHTSGFDVDGKRLYGPSARGLDELDVRKALEGDQEKIQVKYLKFKTGLDSKEVQE